MELQDRGRRARELFESYFAGVRRPVAQTLVLPYALGMLMDDLAQPMNYNSESRRHVVELLMNAIARREVESRSEAYLLQYPPSLERLILLARADDVNETWEHAARVLRDLIIELHSAAASYAMTGAMTGAATV